MAVQFNLLPDVKLEYVKAQRTKHLMTFVSLVVGAAALAIFLFSFFLVNVVQKRDLANLNKDIKSTSGQLKQIKDLDKILTVQNQLSTLTTLHESKPVASRLFAYITSLTPTQASLSKLNIDFAANTISIGGTAPSLDTVSVYTDTIKGTKYITDGETTKTKAFSDVVLSSFGRSDKGASFTIDFKYDPTLFDVKSKVQLIVPTAAVTNETNLFGVGN
jgi:Tfp pilus assembly protein PilN